MNSFFKYLTVGFLGTLSGMGIYAVTQNRGSTIKFQTRTANELPTFKKITDKKVTYINAPEDTKPAYLGLYSAPEIQTERLVLRPIRESDIDAISQTLKDEETVYMLAYMPWPFTKEKTVQYLKNISKSMEWSYSMYWAITLPQQDKVLGIIGLTLELEHDKAIMHYWLDRNSWGHGYMTEAARYVIDFVFRDLELNRLEINHMSINSRSQRVIEKCGYKLECEQEDFLKKGDKFENQKVYRILKREYLPQH